MASDAIFAGVICGHFLAIFTSPLIARALLLAQIQSAEGSGFRLPAVFTGLSPMMLAVPIFMFAVVLWSIAGLVLGALFIGIHSGAALSAVATPDVLYTGIVSLLVVLFTGVLSMFLRRIHWTTAAMALLALVLFGWVLPNVALIHQ